MRYLPCPISGIAPSRSFFARFSRRCFATPRQPHRRQGRARLRRPLRAGRRHICFVGSGLREAGLVPHAGRRAAADAGDPSCPFTRHPTCLTKDQLAGDDHGVLERAEQDGPADVAEFPLPRAVGALVRGAGQQLADRPGPPRQLRLAQDRHRNPRQ